MSNLKEITETVKLYKEKTNLKNYIYYNVYQIILQK